MSVQIAYIALLGGVDIARTSAGCKFREPQQILLRVVQVHRINMCDSGTSCLHCGIRDTDGVVLSGAIAPYLQRANDTSFKYVTS